VKLHRLVLSNYRGIAHREIVLPDNGIIVVSGANEIGKSSMIEAVDLLLEARDRSTKKEVKQVKPTHADVGAEVTAEISSGAYRFIYRKRFHKRCETELTVLSPRREQLTGDEAHERVRAILDETVDTELWRAQRVLQARPVAPADLSDCDALSRALDVAAGQSAALSGEEPALIDRIEAEYARYFTATGRPTGEWAAAISRLAESEAEVARCEAAVAEVDDCVRRHAALADGLADLAAQSMAAQQGLAAARAAAAAVAEQTAQLQQAELVAAAAEKTAAASAAELAGRVRCTADVQRRAAVVAELDVCAAQAAEDESIAREVDREAAIAAEGSSAALAEAQARADAARAAHDRVSDREEAGRLAARLARIDQARGHLDVFAKEIAASAVTESVMRGIEVAAAAVDRASAQTELASARIELTALADVDVCVRGDRLTLPVGETYADAVATTTDVEVADVLRVRVIPGAPASDMHATLEAATTHLAGLLEAVGVGDVTQARAIAEHRRDAVIEHDRLTATLAGLSGDEPVDHMRSRLTTLRNREGAGGDEPGMDAASARQALDAAVSAHQGAVKRFEQSQAVAAGAAAALAQKCTHATVSRERLAAAREELTAAQQLLANQRTTASDHDLGVRARSDGEESQAATARVVELRARLAEFASDRVAADLAEAERHAAERSACHGAVVDQLRDLATQLRVYGTEGRQGRLDAATAALAHADSDHRRVGRRARAAQLLRSVILRHRDDTRRRYVEPFRAEVQRLGRIVFGDTFEVEIDNCLRICGRTLAGRTVPYESLSGGAREQLGIITRLAGAVLVAKEDAVPVIIDDALGFSDPDRLARMGEVFDAVGSDAQVLVLTCSPRRYDSVAGAHHIELTG
jgi:hypothetical protein